jgi:hypothetical protein
VCEFLEKQMKRRITNHTLGKRGLGHEERKIEAEGSWVHKSLHSTPQRLDFNLFKELASTQ